MLKFKPDLNHVCDTYSRGKKVGGIDGYISISNPISNPPNYLILTQLHPSTSTLLEVGGRKWLGQREIPKVCSSGRSTGGEGVGNPVSGRVWVRHVVRIIPTPFISNSFSQSVNPPPLFLTHFAHHAYTHHTQRRSKSLLLITSEWILAEIHPHP